MSALRSYLMVLLMVLLMALGLVLVGCATQDDLVESSEGSDVAAESEQNEAAEATNEPESTEEAVDDTEPEAEEQRVERADDGELFPDVIGAEATIDDDGTWTFSVTLSSPYDTAERYADAWRVVGADGTEFGRRELAHDHANEQPFTRSQAGIQIPENVDTVTIEGLSLIHI